jgi:putative addiction module component (TIGR02574 family)
LAHWRAVLDDDRLSFMKHRLVAEVLELPVAERVQLVAAIWDSTAAAPQALPLTEWQREELDRRLAECEADSHSGSTLEEVLARIRGGS